MRPKYAFFAVLTLLSAILISAYVTGGDLNPNNTPSPTMRTLDELYKNIQPGLPSDWRAYPKALQVENNGAIEMKITGIVQGEIQGSCIAPKPHQSNSIVVIGLGHELNLSFDSGSGQITGTLQHSPLIISKYIDKSSPKLYQACANREGLDTVKLYFYRVNSSGVDELYYTIELKNAKIVNIRTAFPNIEQISIIYETIRWTWEIDGIEFETGLHVPV